MLFNKQKENIKTRVMQKVSAEFTTIDGQVHYTGDQFNWCDSDRLLYSVGEYIMCDIKRDGYIKDENDVMYILQNVLSVKWSVDKELMVNKRLADDYRTFYTYEELEKIGIIEERQNDTSR